MLGFSLFSLSQYFSMLITYFSEFVNFLFLPLKDVILGHILSDNPFWEDLGLTLLLDTFGGFFVDNSLFTILLGSSVVIFVGHTVLKWFTLK